MCGHDLRIRPKRQQRISWLDVLLVFAVIAILGFWWQAGAQPEQVTTEEPVQPILPESIPVLDETSTPTATPEPTATPTAPPPEEVTLTHQVSAGETLLAIAGIYRVTVDEIMRANNRTDEFIGVGETLKIPVRPTSSDATASSATFPYQVRDGDTVASIAILTGSSVTDILASNNLGPNALIRPGDILTIPSQLPPEVFESAVEEAEPTPAANLPSESTAEAESNRIYIQPSLLAPPNEAVFSRNESILLRWASVSILEPNEWYVIQINSTRGASTTIAPQWKKTNTHRLNSELAPPAGGNATYSWQISVIRVTNGAEGNRIFTPTSPPSEIRTFTWQ